MYLMASLSEPKKSHGHRYYRIVEHTGRAGRPRVRQQVEAIDAGLETLGRALRALPPLI
jgi:hypothetical protein